jgi:hypothetical protein
MVLTVQPAAPDDPAGPGWHDRGALGLRAGPPAAQGGTRPRPLRGPLLDRAAPARAYDVHRLRLPAAPAFGWARPEGLGEKRWLSYRVRHRLRAWPPCVRQSSADCSWRSSRPCDARTVGATSGCRLTSKCPGSAGFMVPGGSVMGPAIASRRADLTACSFVSDLCHATKLATHER